MNINKHSFVHRLMCYWRINFFFWQFSSFSLVPGREESLEVLGLFVHVDPGEPGVTGQVSFQDHSLAHLHGCMPLSLN